MIICVIGKARHGKDTAADIIEHEIVNKYNLPVNKLALATPLKEEALKYTGLDTIEEINWYKNEKVRINGIDVRSLLQQLGDSHTSKDKNYYCDLLVKEMNKHCSNTVTIITDVRILAEWEYFKKFSNVVFLKVFRDITLDSDDHNKHASETDVDKMSGDYTIFNHELEQYMNEVRVLSNIIMDNYLSNKRITLDCRIPENVYGVFNKSSYL